MPKILPVCKENYELVKNKCKCVKKTIKKNRKKRTKKKTLKLKIELNKSKNKRSTITSKMTDRTQDVLSILTELKDLMYAKKQRFQGIAYNKSIEKVVKFDKPIYSTNELKEIFGESSSTFKHLKQYFETGKVDILEKHKNDPVKLFTKIYGVGPKKVLNLKIKVLLLFKKLKKEKMNSLQHKNMDFNTLMIFKKESLEAKSFSITKNLQKNLIKLKNLLPNLKSLVLTEEVQKIPEILI